MFLVRVVAALLAALACSSAAAAPLEAYGKLPTIETAAVSPSGHAVALMLTNGERRMLVVHDLARNKAVVRADAGEAKVRDVSWAGDKHLVIVTSQVAAPMEIRSARREWLLGFVFDIETQKTQMLLRNIERVEAMNSLAGMPQVRIIDGKPVIFVEGTVFQNNYGNVALFRQQVGAPRPSIVELGQRHTWGWVIGPDGEPLAQEVYDSDKGYWALKLRGRGGWREAMLATGTDSPPSVLGLGRDGKSVLIRQADEQNRLVWNEMPLDGVGAGGPTPAREEQTAIFDPGDGRLIGHAMLVGDEHSYTFYGENDARIWKAIRAAYPDDAVELVSWSNDRKISVVRVDSATDGPAYALVDLDARRAKWLGGEYIDLKPQDIAPKQPIRFKAADGLELTGYLTLPRGRPAKGLPLVVFPHGGPASRDTPGFDWWAQGMASRGYAVLQVNFRGSDGLGEALLEAGYGQWGRKMQTDLSDGVRHLAAQGMVDPKRVCIVGASYGGYAAAAGATLDRGTYRCAVSVAGVTDLKRHIVYARGRGGRSSERYWTNFIGAKDLGDPVLASYSPAMQADKADIPILLIHGKDDTVVAFEQSRVMADALKRAGKPVELLSLAGEDHWLSRGDTRLQTLQATVAFLEKHNPPN
ncbi:S9 family peptidase [Phenylobacterium sp. J426]|uniref:alpha/beta hydrolase family protein n=1 Tax=Phenylobacterium sp. J426 TaxID=2898439 RepID=UPI00215161FC|nr:S9 family peptidase [Phenylobacterium sp. J426]MCR5874727.1 S9 family peptidase [Phenylobacterium sp. J426]